MSSFMHVWALPELPFPTLAYFQFKNCIRTIFPLGRRYGFIAGRLGDVMLFVLLSENGLDAVLSMAGSGGCRFAK